MLFDRPIDNPKRKCTSLDEDNLPIKTFEVVVSKGQPDEEEEEGTCDYPKLSRW